MHYPKLTDIRIEEISHSYEDFLYRTPIKFGGVALDRVTLLNVDCVVRTGRRPDRSRLRLDAAGQRLVVPVASADLRDHARRHEGAGRAHRPAHRRLPGSRPSHRPDLGAGAGVSQGRRGRLPAAAAGRADPAAVHPGRRQPLRRRPARRLRQGHGLNCYHTYGPDFMSHDLAHYLGAEFRGRTPGPLHRPRAQAAHAAVSPGRALDPIEAGDISQRIGDGLPETLPEWIPFNGLTHIKIKLNGDDLDWDVDRVVRVDRASAEAQKQRGVDDLVLFARFQRALPPRRLPAGVPAAG